MTFALAYYIIAFYSTSTHSVHIHVAHADFNAASLILLLPQRFLPRVSYPSFPFGSALKSICIIILYNSVIVQILYIPIWISLLRHTV